VKASSKITSYNVYPGIHIEYLQADDGLKYNFIIQAGANPREIVQQYSGLKSLRLQNSTLEMKTSLGKFSESIPEAYQVINGTKLLVACSYVLAGNEVRYKLGNYNPNYELIIDPVLLFSSFSGSGDLNYGNTATPGKDGTTYAAGTNFGPNYPTTIGTIQPGFAADSVFSCDAAISKFSSNGTRLLAPSSEGLSIPFLSK
jgi:hypothetical protein